MVFLCQQSSSALIKADVNDSSWILTHTPMINISVN